MPLLQRLACLIVTVPLLCLATDSLAVPIDISADEISRTAEGVVVAKGNVVIKRENETLKADTVYYRSKQQVLEAHGHVVIESPNATIQAEDAVMQTNSKTGNMNRATIILPNGERLVAEHVRQIDDQRFEAEEVTYSTCPIDEESWRIAAKKALLDQEDGSLVTHHGRLELWGLPLFYTPWWQQPLKRKTGLLMPRFATGKRRGTEVAAPLYFAPNGNWDMTLTPRWMSARGVMAETEFRHISRLGREEIRIAGIDDSELGKKRYRFDGTGHWNLPNNISLDIEGDYISDHDYLADFATGEHSSTYYLNSRATLSQGFTANYFSGNWLLQAQYRQNLQQANNRSTLQILPRIESRTEWEVNPNLLFHFDQQTTRFDRKLNVDGWRIDLHPWIEIPWNLARGAISTNLQLGMHHTRYWLQQTTLANRAPARSTGEVSLEIRSHFERISDSRSWRHLLSPTIRYDYVAAPDQATLPNFDSGFGGLTWNNLLSGNRFAGRDRIEKTNRISLLLENRLQHKETVHQNSRDILVFRGGISYDIARVSVDSTLLAAATRPFSNLLAEAVWHPLPSLRFFASGQYSPADRYWSAGRISAHLQADGGNNLNIGYSYADARYATEAQTIHLDGNIHLANRWHMSGKWQYDTILKLSQHTSVELKYRHPCWIFGVEGFRTNRRTATTDAANYGFKILLEFKGVGSVGS